MAVRIRSLRETQGHLRRLAAGRLLPLPLPLPDEVASHLIRFHDQPDVLADPTLRQLFLAYDHAYDLGADDPRLDDLARRIAEANRERYGSNEPPGLDADFEIPALIHGTVNASSPAWERLDSLIRAQLNA
ncbi:MerR family transcriptional regulator [Streptomyces sp. NBC_00513]|uniref:MerR family transcriptional regulator n=1 Tax=unclassified Streptomyces TaxID=2593676 RepID=UPI00225AE1E6|nr:MerR family transcriptional regulator [Streptomyces sp. NBC_00424]MCX5071136.1 MerR family transcriptional regulator [Streptomyces sp. NBC_00424]WUD45445.1 MerR family transcriptional regulator [Streptomyces sp. NBC_00513]